MSEGGAPSPPGGGGSSSDSDATPPAVSTSRTALNGSKERAKEVKKKKRHLLKVKDMSQPLLESATESLRGGGDAPAPGDQGTSTATTTVAPSEAEAKTSCPDYFGVKSYLHNFYESVSVKNPDLYEELEGGDYRYLIRPKKPRCRALWWKVAVWSGVNLLVVGVIVILVGYLVPRRPVVVGYQDDLEVIDRAALGFNYNLDVCKLAGLVVFCIGGMVVAVALLFPSFLYNYCDEDWALYAEPFKLGTSAEEVEEPRSPTEKQVPATGEFTHIQPVWGEDDPGEEAHPPAEAPAQLP